MKIIEALKSIKRLQEKAGDLQTKIGRYCVDFDFETPTYPDTKAQVKEWLQSHSDSVKEILRLRIAVQRTNLATTAVVTLGEKEVTKTVAEWTHRRRDLAKNEEACWGRLGDRGLQEGHTKASTGEVRDVKIRRYFDPLERDRMVLLYSEEPSRIDAVLEIINAVTDVLE